MRISKKYNSSEWNALNLSNSQSDDWNTGIEIIKDRFESRYINYLSQLNQELFSGFIVMSSSCMLIETIMQFTLGVEQTSDIHIYQGNQKRLFADFLLYSPHFPFFNSLNKGYRFYWDFRNGLLHQSQTNGLSKINVCK